MDRTDRSPRHRIGTGWLAPLLAALVAGALGSGCASMGLDRGRPLVPSGFQTRSGPFLVCTNARLAPDAPVVRELANLEDQIGRTLGLRIDPSEKPIEVYLLDDRTTFDHFLQTHYPDLPRRRAFFLANGQQRVVYTFVGDRTVEDVRHEATHALLHVALGDVPLWLDEGLAEYFEGSSGMPGEAGGVNAEHLERLPLDVAAGWRPDLRRLESLRSVREMTPRDYREAWAWVHFLLDDDRSHRAALLAYLGDLRAGPDPAPISGRLGDGVPPSAIMAHLREVRERPPTAPRTATASAGTLVPRDPTLRLQSGVVDPDAPDAVVRAVGTEGTPAAPAPVRRRTILNRMFGWIGS